MSDGITEALRNNLDAPKPLAARRIHVHVDLVGLLSRRRRIVGVVDENGKELDDEEARRRLLALVIGGRRVMPIGVPCEGFDDVTGCPGHEP